MHSPPPRRVPEEVPDLVVQRTEGDEGVEVTFFEPGRDPEERTARWITAAESDCVPEGDWR